MVKTCGALSLTPPSYANGAEQLPSLAKEGWPRRQAKAAKPPSMERTRWFVRETDRSQILNQPRRLRPLRRLRKLFLLAHPRLVFQRGQFWFSALFLTMLLLTGVVCFGQQRDGTLQGKVLDQLGGAIADADVSVVRDDVTLSVKSNRQGGFAFSRLPPGRYSIRVVADGFTPYENKSMEISNETRLLSIQLRVRGQDQEVTVTTDLRLSIDADNSATMLVLRGAALDALPNGPGGLEAALQLLTARAGNPRGPEFIVNGFSDGRLPPKESIREIRINQNAFSAQYEKPGLGRVEILTKPGTDSVQGTLFSSFNDGRLNSRNPFAPERSKFQSRLYGANLSGPIVPRHISFFLDADRWENDNNAVINATVLDAALNVTPFNSSVVTPHRRTTASSRLDFRINESHTLVTRYAYARSESKNLGIGDFSLPSRAYRAGNLDHTFQLTETGIFNQSVINEFRVQYLEEYRRQNADSSLPVLRVPEAFIGGGSEIGMSLDRHNAIEVDNNTMWASGNHALKTGVRFRRSYLSSVSAANFAGTYTFAGRSAPELTPEGTVVVDGAGNPVIVPITTLESYRRTLFFQQRGLSAAGIRELGGGPAQFSIAAGNPQETLSQYDLGVYLQDDWRAASNFTLSAGLRYETQNHLRRRADFAPRIGLAWTPSTSKDAKLVLRAGAGFFYDRLSETLVLRAKRLNGVSQQQYVVSDPGVLDSFPVIPPLQSLAEISAPSAITRLSETLRAPYMMQTNLSIERTFPWNISTSATYMRSQSLHALRSRNVNAPNPDTAIRPTPALGEVFEYESSGRSRQNQVVLNLTQRLGPRLTYYGTYIWSRSLSDTDGPGSFPASSYNLAAEWGRSLQDIRQTFYWGGWITGPFKLDINPTFIIRSGAPFNITTGRDLDGDSLFLERPALASDESGTDVVATPFGRFNLSPGANEPRIGRNFGHGPRFMTTHLKIGKTFNVTPASNSVNRPGHSHALTIALQIQNLFNHTNPDVPAGSLSSPSFGRSYSSVGDFGFGTNAAGNRRIEGQIYLRF
jgi:hypothetical protein